MWSVPFVSLWTRFCCAALASWNSFNRPGWPGTHRALCTSRMLGLKACTTTSAFLFSSLVQGMSQGLEHAKPTLVLCSISNHSASTCLQFSLIIYGSYPHLMWGNWHRTETSCPKLSSGRIQVSFGDSVLRKEQVYDCKGRGLWGHLASPQF